MGFVYIMTNPSLAGWIKIGETEKNDIQERVKELSRSTSIPLSFRCYAIYEANNPKEVEEQIHNIIDILDPSLRSVEALENGIARKREFFRISPEKAFGVFKAIANLRNDADRLTLLMPTLEEIREEEMEQEKKRRCNCTFKALGIKEGDKIVFCSDENIVATVQDEKNQVTYQGETLAISPMARKLLKEKRGYESNVDGWYWFKIDNEKLTDRRNRIESETLEE